MGERIAGRNFLSSPGHHQATRWTDEALIDKLKSIVDNGEPTTVSYLEGHYSAFNASLRNHGWRRIFRLAGIPLLKQGSHKSYG